jgi:hypothetical protein
MVDQAAAMTGILVAPIRGGLEDKQSQGCRGRRGQAEQMLISS